MEGHLPEPTGPQDGRPGDPSRLRISDEDRHQVAEVLRRAAGEGRIDLEELDQRLEATYRAKTYGELVPITADLPVTGDARPTVPARPTASGLVRPPGSGAASYPATFSVMSDTRRVGRWRVEETQSAFALMGSVTLDLREAEFAARQVVVNASAVMGEVKIVVNAQTAVVVEGVGVMGDYTEQRPRVAAALTDDSPLVRVRGLALMGSVHVQRKGPPAATVRARLGRPGR